MSTSAAHSVPEHRAKPPNAARVAVSAATCCATTEHLFLLLLEEEKYGAASSPPLAVVIVVAAIAADAERCICAEGPWHGRRCGARAYNSLGWAVTRFVEVAATAQGLSLRMQRGRRSRPKLCHRQTSSTMPGADQALGDPLPLATRMRSFSKRAAAGRVCNVLHVISSGASGQVNMSRRAQQRCARTKASLRLRFPRGPAALSAWGGTRLGR